MVSHVVWYSMWYGITWSDITCGLVQYVECHDNWYCITCSMAWHVYSPVHNGGHSSSLHLHLEVLVIHGSPVHAWRCHSHMEALLTCAGLVHPLKTPSQVVIPFTNGGTIQVWRSFSNMEVMEVVFACEGTIHTSWRSCSHMEVMFTSGSLVHIVEILFTHGECSYVDCSHMKVLFTRGDSLSCNF